MNGGVKHKLTLVDFRKGCYLGQELTHRTKHVGVVRKRIAPFMIYSDVNYPPKSLNFISEQTSLQGKEEEIKLETEKDSIKRNAIIGKTCASRLGNLGLALVKLDHIHKEGVVLPPLVLPNGTFVRFFSSPTLEKLQK